MIRKGYKSKPQIALALGSGGTKGVAHLGLLKALEDAGIEIVAIAGSSIGGLIAAVYARGRKIDQIIELISSVSQRQLFQRSRGVDNALLGLDRVATALLDLIGDIDFEELNIPLALTAVDLDTGQELILNSGKVIDSVLATIAVPGIFPPRVINKRTLIDGGVTNPVPVEIAGRLRRGIPVFASVLSKPPAAEQRLPITNLLPPNPAMDRLSQFRLAKALSIFTQAMNINGRVLTELRLIADQPSVIIRPDVDHIGLLDPVDVKELIRIGEKATEAMLPMIFTELQHSHRSKNWLSKVLHRFRSDEINA